MPHRDQLEFDLGKRLTHSFDDCCAFDREPPFRFGCATTMGEPKEVKRLWFTIASFSSTLRGEPTEFDQSCFVQM